MRLTGHINTFSDALCDALFYTSDALGDALFYTARINKINTARISTASAGDVETRAWVSVSTSIRM